MRKTQLTLGLGALVGATALGIAYLASQKDPAAAAPTEPPLPLASSRPDPAFEKTELPLSVENPSPVATEPTLKTPEVPAKRGPLRILKGEPIPELFPYEKERTEISDLATRPNSTNLEALAKYLKHSDAMVRDEARLALLRTSNPQAVEILRKAAGSAPNAAEAKDLRESADFLAQATGSESAPPPF